MFTTYRNLDIARKSLAAAIKYRDLYIRTQYGTMLEAIALGASSDEELLRLCVKVNYWEEEVYKAEKERCEFLRENARGETPRE